MNMFVKVNPQQFKTLQEILLKQGYKWKSGSTEVLPSKCIDTYLVAIDKVLYWDYNLGSIKDGLTEYTYEQLIQELDTMKPIEAIEALKLGKDVEYRLADTVKWYPFGWASPVSLFSGEYSFRIKPQEMITIGNVSFPKPITELPEGTVELYVPDFSFEAPYFAVENDLGSIVKRGVAHLTKENAIAHAEALIKLSGGSYDSSN